MRIGATPPAVGLTQSSPLSTVESEKLPAYFISSESVTPKEHVDVQAAAQKLAATAAV